MSDPGDTKTCPRCAETIKTAAVVCRYCNHEFGPGPASQATTQSMRPVQRQEQAEPKKRITAWQITGGLIAALVIVIVASKLTSPSGTSMPANGQDSSTGVGLVAATDVPVPQEEQKFIAAAKSARDAYNAAANDMAKGGTRASRRSGICQALNGSAVASRWIGTIKTLSSNSDGKGVLEIDLGDGVAVGTWNNAISDIQDNTLMEQTSPVFQAASAMKVGDKVQFSGTFFASDTDCVEEKSVTLSGSMQDPGYIMRFSEIGVPERSKAQLETPQPANGNAAAAPSSDTASTPPPENGMGAEPAHTQQVSANPSFDCLAAKSEAERLVCSSPNLAGLDVEVSSMYRAARSAAADPSVIVADQRQWMEERDACASVACLADIYNRRKTELAQWVGPNP